MFDYGRKDTQLLKRVEILMNQESINFDSNIKLSKNI